MLRVSDQEVATDPVASEIAFETARPEATVRIVSVEGGRYSVNVTPQTATEAPRLLNCTTPFTLETVLLLLEEVGPIALCDFLDRMNCNASVGKIIAAQILAYLDTDRLSGARILDFGCGAGHSSFILAELLPRADIIGVELNPDLVSLAQRLVACRHMGNVEFLTSPSGSELPPGIGSFDVVMLSAAYEHLLPHERRAVLPRVWEVMKPGAIIFINQTPHRWFPYEHHSTGLWGINYLPDALACRLARYGPTNHAANQLRMDWTSYLRSGIRGGTERSIVRELTSGKPDAARILRPTRFPDRAAYWLAQTSPRWRRLKRAIAAGFRLSERVFGTIPSMNVDVAIQKL